MPGFFSAASVNSNRQCCCAPRHCLGGLRRSPVIADGSGEPRILPPREREAGVLPMLEALVEIQPLKPGVPQSGGLHAAMTTLRPLLKPGSLILLLSDFAGLDKTTEDLIAGTIAHSDVRLLWIVDPLESSGLPGGSYRVGLPDRLWWMDGERSRTPWKTAWQKREQHLSDVAMRLNLPLNRLTTNQPVTDSLVALLREPKWAA